MLTSDTRRQEAYDDRSILMKRSFANTSSFLTSSPCIKQTIYKSNMNLILSLTWTLVFPAAPNRLEMPALRTAVDTALQADWMLDRSWVRSPAEDVK